MTVIELPCMLHRNLAFQSLALVYGGVEQTLHHQDELHGSVTVHGLCIIHTVHSQCCTAVAVGMNHTYHTYIAHKLQQICSLCSPILQMNSKPALFPTLNMRLPLGNLDSLSPLNCRMITSTGQTYSRPRPSEGRKQW